MLLAAVHGLRLGALVQLLTFGGFWLGLLLGTLVWVHALAFIHHANERAGHHGRRRLLHRRALWVSSAARWGPTATSTLRRHHLGHVDAALGVGVAVVAVLLSSWLVASVISSPNSRFTWLSSAVARSDILHSVDRVLPQVPPVFTDLQNYLNEQGFPQVFSTLTPPLDRIRRHADRRRHPGPGRPGDPVDGQDPRGGLRRRTGGLRASWWATAWWPPTPTWWRARAPRRSS